MDINSQQQINTFVGGMNTDTSDALLESNQYRYAENLRIVTNKDSNTGELRMIEGVEEFIKNEPSGDSKPFGENAEILYLTSIRLYGIVIVRNYNDANEHFTWSIYRFKGKSLVEIFGPCLEPIWDLDTDIADLSVVVKYESKDNAKIYIADGIHEIMHINLFPEYCSTDFKTICGDNKVSLPKLEINISDNVGQLKSAKVQYTYRIYTKYNAATNIAPLSEVLSLYKDGNSGYATGFNSGRAVDIKLPAVFQEEEEIGASRPEGIGFEIDPNWNGEDPKNRPIINLDDSEIEDPADNDNSSSENSTNAQQYSSGNVYIQLFRINYIENGQLPTVTMIYDNKYTVNSTFVDYGTDNIKTISIAEFLSYITIGIVPKNLETKNNYLFAGNLKYKQDDIDSDFAKLNLSEYFDISQTTGESYVISEFNQDTNYKAQHKAFRPGETYRFGIIFYDEDGNRSSVFRLCDDVTIADYSNWNWFGIIDHHYTNTYYNTKFTVDVPTIQIKLKKEIPGCSKYEIVRCIRTLSDKRTITQGLLGRPVEYNASGKIYPSGFLTMNYLNFGAIVSSCNKGVLCFASPEYVYQNDDIQDILNQYAGSLNVHTVAEYTPYIVSSSVENFHGKSFKIGYVPGVSRDQNAPYVFKQIGDDSNRRFEIDLYAAMYNVGTNTDNVNEIKRFIPYTRNGKTTCIKFNHITPRSSVTKTEAIYKIDELAYPKVPEFNTFASGEDIRFQDDVTTIGNCSYTGWSAASISEISASDLRTHFTNNTLPIANNTIIASVGNVNATTYPPFVPIGSTGSCILMKTDTVIPDEYKQNGSKKQYGPWLMTVADIRKTAIPYGGNENKNVPYYSFGDVFDNINRSTHILTSGDCYIRMFQYNALHTWYDTTYVNTTRMGTVYSIPLFMDIDLHGQFGSPYNPNMQKPYYIQDKACAFDDYILEKDAYLYNTAYNAYPDVIGYSEYLSDKDTSWHDVRVHYSEQKTDGEYIDSWLQFKTMNFLDVDSLFGEITDMKLFKDRLMFWQQHATGILAVNERVILKDSDETLVTLGTGAVLDRYYYISTIYGMKPSQHTSCVSSDALYWWDGYSREILLYAENRSEVALSYAKNVIPLSLIKNVKNYINSNNESMHPHIYYNRKYKEVECQCVNSEVLSYNEILQRFTSVYTERGMNNSDSYGFDPMYSTYVDNTLYLTDGTSIYKVKANYDDLDCKLFGKSTKASVYPYLKYVVNANNTMGKTYDIQIIGGNLYGGSLVQTHNPSVEGYDFEIAKLYQNQPNLTTNENYHKYHTTSPLKVLQLRYTTPLKQVGIILDGKGITNREYDYRLNIPRESGNDIYGGRLRGKTMQCELWSTSSSTDFSLQYITTKYRMSWS